MDLRKRTIHALAGTGALLIVAGLSVGGGVAVAAAPPDHPPGDGARVTTAASDKKSSDGKSSDDKASGSKSGRKSKGRKSKSGGADSTGSSNSTGSGGTDSTDRSTDSGDSTGSDSTGTSDTTTPARSTPSTTTPPTTRPTPTTATTAPPRTAPPSTAPPTTAPPTTAPPTTASTAPATSDTAASERSGQYNGQPYQATEATTAESSSTTTAPPAKAKAPVSRSGAGLGSGSGSGSGLPSVVYPVDPGSDPAGSSPAPAGAPAPPGSPSDPSGSAVVPAQSQPTLPPDRAVAGSGGVSDPDATSAPGAEVDGAGTERGDAGAVESSRELVRTGDSTRRLLLFGGVALLMGAVVVAFGGRDAPALAAATVPAGPVRRRPRPRKELDGWEDGVPLAPAKRELARSRLGLSADSYFDDEPGA